METVPYFVHAPAGDDRCAEWGSGSGYSVGAILERAMNLAI